MAEKQWTYWEEIGEDPTDYEHHVFITTRGRKIDLHTGRFYRFNFRLRAPTIIAGEEETVLRMLTEAPLICDYHHTVVAIINLHFEIDVRHTVFDVITLPVGLPEPWPAAIKLLKWPTPLLTTMDQQYPPVRARKDEILGKVSAPLRDSETISLIGVLTDADEIFDNPRKDNQ